LKCWGKLNKAPALYRPVEGDTSYGVVAAQANRLLRWIHCWLRKLILPSKVSLYPPFGTYLQRQPDVGYSPMLSRIMDLDLPLSVALGRSTLQIQDILKLTSGSLIELDRRVGESVELLIHGTVVAKGEVVSVKGNYAIRIKEIISRTERIALQQQ
jgi:flagellar motor switch protein FliN